MLTTLFATGALAASASAALPEFTGFSMHQAVAFTGTSGTVHIAEPGGSYICGSSSITGEIINATEVANVVMKFNTANGGLGDCVSFCKNATGLWETKPLKGRIAYLAKSTKTVGLLLEAVTEPFATCTTRFSGGSGTISGSIIAEIGPVNVSRTTPFSLNYATSTGSYHQTWRHFEGEELLHNLAMLPHGGTTPHEFSIEDNMTLTTARAMEIRA